jgi:NAD(P)-dependent dehydrogenase (short-subunit alcohol dehydrogenase family)
MDLQLNGKRALVSGSTAGIGLAIATALAKEGAAVVVNGRTQKRVDDAIAKIQGEAPGASVQGIAADLGTAAGVAATVQKFSDVEILVNNLGIFEPKPFEEITDEDWLHFFEVNVLSGIRLSRHYLPLMKARNWGRIVFISSESALNVPPEMMQYGLTKTAQLSVSRGLAEMTVGTNVTVNTVMPGPTSSEGVGEYVSRLAASHKKDKSEVEKDFFKSARPSSILQRFITTEEIASVVAFVCSPLAASMNGSAVRAEGGLLRSIA